MLQISQFNGPDLFLLLHWMEENPPNCGIQFVSPSNAPGFRHAHVYFSLTGWLKSQFSEAW